VVSPLQVFLPKYGMHTIFLMGKTLETVRTRLDDNIKMELT
jgi:hypothetical protein